MEWKLQQFNEMSTEKLYACLKLRVDVFVVEQNAPYEELDNWDQGSVHLTCEENGTVLAYARLMPAGVKYPLPSIGRVIVRPEARGRGLARELMERSLDFMISEWDVTEIHLQGQTYLTEFYQSFGFQPISAPYDEDGIPHVDMRFTRAAGINGK